MPILCPALPCPAGSLADLRRDHPSLTRDSRLSESPESPPPPRGIRKVLPIPSLTTHENIYTVPNLLTFSRLIAAPAIGYAILHDAHSWALGLFVYAGVSDLLDGWIARRWNLQTVVGSVVDPMADKTLMTVLTVCLATQGLLPSK
jgi:cardiolipin synthase (CMP-forming)